MQLAEVGDDPGADHDMAVSGTARQQVGQRDRAVGDIDHRMNDSALRITATFAQLDVRISTSSGFHRTDLKPGQLLARSVDEPNRLVIAASG